MRCKYKPYYKKVDISLFEWGVVIPREYIDDFLAGKSILAGTARKITVVFEKKEYQVDLRHVERKKYANVYMLRWDSNRELVRKLRRTFIQSYVILKGQKELFDTSKTDRKFFRGKMSGKQQEVLCIQPISSSKIHLTVFIKVEDDWNLLFERLADENVFGWLFEKDKQYLISHSSAWYPMRDFPKHKGAVNVIYYLASKKKKTLYIGKAEVFGRRVRPGKQHQGMSEDWDMFRYDIVHKEFAGILERIEDHTIRSVASILTNTKDHPTLGLSQYKLVNRNWKKI